MAMDMTPHWLRLTVEGLLTCEAASTELRRVWRRDERPEEAEALGREFWAAMQTCAAAAFAIDAFYASVQAAASTLRKAAAIRRRVSMVTGTRRELR